MVRLSIWRDSEPRKIALRDAIQFELDTQQSTLSHKRLSVDIDLDVDIGLTSCSAAVRSAIETVLGLAIHRSPRGGLVSIVGCMTSRGIEIEVADDGKDASLPRFHAFQPVDCGKLIAAPGSNAQINYYAIPCPQGGVAWTIVLKRTQSIAKAA